MFDIKKYRMRAAVILLLCCEIALSGCTQPSAGTPAPPGQQGATVQCPDGSSAADPSKCPPGNLLEKSVRDYAISLADFPEGYYESAERSVYLNATGVSANDELKNEVSMDGLKAYCIVFFANDSLKRAISHNLIRYDTAESANKMFKAQAAPAGTVSLPDPKKGDESFAYKSTDERGITGYGVVFRAKNVFQQIIMSEAGSDNLSIDDVLYLVDKAIEKTR